MHRYAELPVKKLHVDRLRKSLRKKAKRGFRGYPLATIAHYGPDDRKATKVVVSIVAYEGASPEPMRKWFSDEDVRNDEQILGQIKEFLTINGAVSVAMFDKIIGCPHEEAVDYPAGEQCPQCAFWQGRDRWTGEKLE